MLFDVCFTPTNLFAFSVRCGVVGDLKVIQIQYFLHLIVVSPSLADYSRYVK